MQGGRNIEMIGAATLVEGRVVPDGDWTRIEQLLTSRLEGILVAPNGDALYVDSSTGKLWELNAKRVPPSSRRLTLRPLDALSAHDKYGGGVAWGEYPGSSAHGVGQLAW